MSSNPYTDVLTATIAAGASQSDILSLEGYTMVGIEMPSAWTAAGITFLSSDLPVYTDDGTEVSLTVDASRVVGITGTKADALAALTSIRLRSGTAATPVTQDAARTIYVRVKA